MTRRTCPRCQQPTAHRWCCGLDLFARKRWQMTRDRVRMIHVLARSRKGLTEEQYRLRPPAWSTRQGGLTDGCADACRSLHANG